MANSNQKKPATNANPNKTSPASKKPATGSWHKSGEHDKSGTTGSGGCGSC